MNKPTQGPWKISDYQTRAIDGADGFFVCNMYRDGLPLERDANAALIVAAVNACFAVNPHNPLAIAVALPEVVSMLNRVEDYLQGIRTGKAFEEGDLVDQIKAAIARGAAKS